jgi:hypothetical protein
MRAKKYDAKYLNKNLIEIKLKTLGMVQYRIIIISERSLCECGGGVKGKKGITFVECFSPKFYCNFYVFHDLLVLSPCALAEILGYLYNNVQQYKTDG